MNRNLVRIGNVIYLDPRYWKVGEHTNYQDHASTLGKALILLATLQLIWPFATIYNWQMVQQATLIGPLGYLLIATWALFLFFIPHLYIQGNTLRNQSQWITQGKVNDFTVRYFKRMTLLHVSISILVQVAAVIVLLVADKNGTLAIIASFLGVLTLLSDMALFESYHRFIKQ
jgi:hypothetical protein